MVEALVRTATGLYESEQKLVEDSQKFWNNESSRSHGPNSHWRGHGPFRNDQLWLDLGRMHLKLLQRTATWAGLSAPYRKVIEWGCGGGMNAVHVAPLTEKLYGVEISSASLHECSKQVEKAGAGSFVPIHITTEDPEVALELIDEPCDAFLCTYVFELLPTTDYGLRLLNIASSLLRPGGIALIQIKYASNSMMSRPRRWGYRRNMADMSTYDIDEFWKACKAAGLDPVFVHLIPEQPELSEERYAYFALQKAKVAL